MASPIRGITEDRPFWVIPTVGGSARRIGDASGRVGTWSPDGRHIVFGHGSALFRVNVDGTHCRKILDTRNEICVDCLRWAPAHGAKVLRLSMRDRDTGVDEQWEVASDGAGLHPLFRRRAAGAVWPNSDYGGNWIPSGKYYLFASLRGATSSIWALRESPAWLPAFARRPVQIHSSPMAFTSLAASLDGKRVFFAAAQERSELVRYDARRGQCMPYLSGIAGRWIDCSHDGRWVAYTMAADDTLWRSRPDGSERVQLTSAPMHVYLPRWSPDGTRIAFGGSPGDRTSKVYVIPVSQSGASDPQAITSAPFYEGEPSSSPEGNSLVFSRSLPRGVPGQPGLYVMDWKTRQTEFIPGSQAWRPAWSPDPRYIAASTGAQILLFDFHTRQWTLLSTGTGLGPPHWSHDAKYVYYQEVFGGVEQPVVRVRIADRKMERVMGSRQFLQSNVITYALSGLAPGDEPVASIRRTNSDLFALDVDLP